ncbi:hypothetical protein HHL19_26975 [Streptomyces sp. R302]|nr:MULTISPECIES: hypothetical protein [unclassified Streptomyces]NML52337.1 hypothetical protein [Streptomyces sp. R301]NML82197.1 hypothetical protein [Streptomyces sp. R302]
MFSSLRRTAAIAALSLALVGLAAEATIGWDSHPAGGTSLAAGTDTIGWD